MTGSMYCLVVQACVVLQFGTQCKNQFVDWHFSVSTFDEIGTKIGFGNDTVDFVRASTFCHI
jgi:hypothetical protein